jgi:hypothetical protein
MRQKLYLNTSHREPFKDALKPALAASGKHGVGELAPTGMPEQILNRSDHFVKVSSSLTRVFTDV